MIARIVLVPCVAIGLWAIGGACSHETLAASDVWGQWCATEESAKVYIRGESDRSNCCITIREDGSFEGRVPDVMLPPGASGALRVARGKWKLMEPELLDYPTIRLMFEDLDGKRVDQGGDLLHAYHRTEGLTLSFWVNDTGSAVFEFRRAE